MYLSIIIPAYNEEKRIGKTLRAIDKYLRTQNYSYEIIVVDDGSKDRTREVVKSLEDAVQNLKLHELQHNGGKGYAVQQGILASEGSYCLFMDADHSTSIDHLERMFPHIQANTDVVVSSRHVKGSVISVQQPWHRVLLGYLFRLLVSIVVPLGIHDTQNGFKLFTRPAAFTIFSQQRIFRWAFDVEVLAIAKKLGFKITEVPVTWKDDERSKLNFKGMVHMLIEVFAVRKNLLVGHYYRPTNIGDSTYFQISRRNIKQTGISHTRV